MAVGRIVRSSYADGSSHRGDPSETVTPGGSRSLRFALGGTLAGASGARSTSASKLVYSICLGVVLIEPTDVVTALAYS